MSTIYFGTNAIKKNKTDNDELTTMFTQSTNETLSQYKKDSATNAQRCKDV